MKTIRRIATSVCAFAAMAVTVAAQESLSKSEEMMKKSLSERLGGSKPGSLYLWLVLNTGYLQADYCVVPLLSTSDSESSECRS
jgi:hypothetical protein